MSGSSYRRVPFSGMDGLIHVLDQSRRPQTIEVEVAISDDLDEERLRDTVAVAAGRHPMARARQVRARASDFNYVWEIGDSC